MLQKSYKFENDKYSSDLNQIGFEQEKLVSEGGSARYKITIAESELNSFRAIATATVDFDNDGTFNVWEVNQEGQIKEVTPD
jgi:type IV pilus assembly protein PilE